LRSAAPNLKGKVKVKVWGGHSCPPPLPLTFLCSYRESVQQPVFEPGLRSAAPNLKSKVKGGGQECPPHTTISTL
jgi:hypothetical protein